MLVDKDAFRKYRHLLGVAGRKRFDQVMLLAVVVSSLEAATMLAIAPFLRFLIGSSDGALVLPSVLQPWAESTGFETLALGAGMIMALLILITHGLKVAHEVAVSHCIAYNVSELSRRSFSACLARDYDYFLTTTRGRIASTLLTEVNRVAEVYTSAIVGLGASLSVCLCLGLVLIALDPMIAVVASGLFIAFYFGVYRRSSALLREFGQQTSKENSQRHSLVSETLSGIKSIILNNEGAAYLARFDASSSALGRMVRRMHVWGALPKHLIEFIALGGMIFFCVVYIVSGGRLESVVPELAVFAIAGFRLLPSLQNAYRQQTLIRHHAAAVHTLYDSVGDEPVARSSGVTGGTPCPKQPDIQLRDVSYRYPGAELVSVSLDELSIPAGTKLAIVGPSGSGKSTTLDILVGLLSPDSGSVSYSGIDSRDIDKKSLWERIAYVGQSNFVADMTVAENIALGPVTDDGHLESLKAAARLACLDEELQRLPNGYQTRLAEGVYRLSGGQEQRLCIARALARDADILVLDEATSALDADTENRLLQNIVNAKTGQTVIMVTHRESVLRYFQRVYELQDGRVRVAR